MNLMKKNILLLLTVAGINYGKAQTANEKKHVHWKTYYEPSKENLNEGFLVFEAVIDEGWQMFAQNQLPDLPVGIEIMIKESKNFTEEGLLSGPLPIISFSHKYNKPVAVYKGTVVFKQKISFKKKEEFKINVSLENEEFSEAEEITLNNLDVVINVKPSKGVRLKFL